MGHGPDEATTPEIVKMVRKRSSKEGGTSMQQTQMLRMYEQPSNWVLGKDDEGMSAAEGTIRVLLPTTHTE